jgi:hypothetical protein
VEKRYVLGKILKQRKKYIVGQNIKKMKSYQDAFFAEMTKNKME